VADKLRARLEGRIIPKAVQKVGAITPAPVNQLVAFAIDNSLFITRTPTSVHCNLTTILHTFHSFPYQVLDEEFDKLVASEAASTELHSLLLHS
jgi:hypothetical protein